MNRIANIVARLMPALLVVFTVVPQYQAFGAYWW